MVLLGLVASALGLLMPEELYGESAVAAIIQGQDLATLLSLPVLVVALVRARAGSVAGLIVWAGVLSYVLYTYTGGAAHECRRRTLPAPRP